MRLPKTLAVCVVVLLGASSAAMAATSNQRSSHLAGRYTMEPGDGYAVTASVATGGGVTYVAGVGPVTAHPPAASAEAVALATGSTTTAGVATTAGAATTASAATTPAAASTGSLAAAAGLGTGSGLLAAAPSAPVIRPAALPIPAAGDLPSVTPLGAVRSADAVVMLRAPITAAQAAKVARLSGIAAVESVDTGTVDLAGAPVVTFGVDPGTFRAFTPLASASSNSLWQYLAGGALVSSYEMASDRNLKLGAEDPIVSPGEAHPIQGWMGAFAAIGLPGVDLLVDHAYATDLGLAPDTGLVISAPDAPGQQLLKELQGTLPGAAVELLHPDQVANLISGNGLNGTEVAAMIAAALSRVGLPYSWGAAGPSSFDCSGLVQWSFAQAGILMPRTAAEQFLTGVHLPLADAAPGDLLFWTYDPNDPGFVDHTAIYLGDGLMVVAPHTGLDVEVVQVPTANFAGAVQVLLQAA